jgi:hypothetical protein
LRALVVWSGAVWYNPLFLTARIKQATIGLYNLRGFGRGTVYVSTVM